MPSAEFKKKGSFQEVVLPALLVHAVNSRFTGMFRAERESIIKVIYFKEGEIAFASSNQPSDRLGEVLIKRGQLTREQLDMAMSKLEANVSLGRMLVELGYLSPKELLAGAKTQVEEILYSLNTWKEGNFEFTEGPLPPRIVDLKLNSRQVIFQCILQVEDRPWVLREIGSMEAVYGAEPELPAVLEAMKLEPEVEQVIRNINGNNTVRDLSARSRLEEFTVTKVVAALHMLNLTRLTVHESAGGESLARLGDEEDEREATDQTLVNREAGSETLPGFGTGYEAAPAASATRRAGEYTVPGAPIPETTAESDASEEMPFEEESEEGIDEEPIQEEEDEAGGRRWLLPVLALAGVAVLAAALWYFLLGGAPAGTGEATPVVSRTPGAGATASGTATPAAVAVAATATPTSPSGATPTGIALASPTAALAAATPVLATPVPFATTAMIAGGTPLPAATATAMPAATATAMAVGRTPPLAQATPALRATPPTVASPTAVAVLSRTPPPQPTRMAAITPVLPPRVTATPAALATPATRPTPPAARTPPGPGSSGTDALASATARTGRSRLTEGKYREAAQTFRQAVASARGYSLQLEIVCQDSSVGDGFRQSGGSEDYFILPFTYRGRSCYRAFWGVYDSEAQARQAASGVPAFFRNQLRGRAVPVVSLGAVR